LGLHAWPWPSQDPIPGSIHERRPERDEVFQYAYSTAWFTTSLIAFNVVLSLVYVFCRAMGPRSGHPTAPKVPTFRSAPDLFVVLGQQHDRTVPKGPPAPRWPDIPDRLYSSPVYKSVSDA
jgi:hypothetical protein